MSSFKEKLKYAKVSHNAEDNSITIDLRDFQQPNRLKDGYDYNPLGAGEFRNKLCICGSGKKIKKCCGKENIVTVEQKKALENLAKAQAKLFYAEKAMASPFSSEQSPLDEASP